MCNKVRRTEPATATGPDEPGATVDTAAPNARSVVEHQHRSCDALPTEQYDLLRATAGHPK
ncbi:hypothetical protein ACIA8F_29635 [Streptomyces sp. NPDC051563]|uniref:hypothetical protein n=1 Tax=Streptomyces sp. NPDC051563 TaxID=3365659 RepID=UPI00378ACC9B